MLKKLNILRSSEAERNLLKLGSDPEFPEEQKIAAARSNGSDC
jgi:hypothetical protein